MAHSTQGHGASSFYCSSDSENKSLAGITGVVPFFRFLPDTRGELLFRSDAQFRQHIRLTNQVAFSLRKLPQRILVSRGSCLQRIPNLFESLGKSYQFLIKHRSSLDDVLNIFHLILPLP